MLYKYAVEPQAIGSSWQTFRYVIEKFGFDKGRLVCQFPKHWFSDVYQAANSLQPVQKKRVEVALNQAKKNKVVRCNRPYDSSLGTWLKNALVEHRREPFHAIIAAENPSRDEAVLCADELDEGHALMAVPHECAVPRDVQSLVAALYEMLCFGSRIVFVDPFFDLYNARQQRVIFKCLDIVKQMNSGAICEIHYRDREKGHTNVELERDAGGLFKDIIPEGMVLNVFCWREKDQGEDFHARYLLTDKGGIRVDAGFEPVGAHQQTDMALMDFDLSQTKLRALAREANVYDLVDPAIQVAPHGKVRRI